MLGSTIEHPRRTFWACLGIALTVILLAMAQSFIGPLVVGVFVYYASRPVYRRINGFVRNDTASAVLSLLFFVIPVLSLVGYTFSIVITELTTFLDAYELTRVESAVRPYVEQSVPGLSSAFAAFDLSEPIAFITSEQGFNAIQSAWGSVLSSLSIVGTVFINLLIVLVVAFYLLRDDDNLSRWMSQFSIYGGRWNAFADKVDEDLSAIFFGNLLNAVITGVIAVIVYTGMSFIEPAGLDLSYPALIGLLTGIASLIPIVGMKLVYIPVTGYIGLQVIASDRTGLSWFPLAFLGVSLVIVDFLPDLFLRPYVSGKNIHVGAIMLAYIVGPVFFGWYGLFLAPVGLVLFVHFVDIIVPSLLAEADSA